MTQLQAIDNLKQILIEHKLTNNTAVQRVNNETPRKIVACPANHIVESPPQPTICSQTEPPHRYPTRYQFNKVTQSQLEEEINVVIDEKTGKSLTYRQLIKHPDHAQKWNTSCANELGRLTQGVGNRIKGTNTAFWMTLDSIPPSLRKDITYANFVVDLRPTKEDPYRTRMTAGGDKIHYPDDVATPTGDLITTKVLLNSVISTPNAKFMTIDMKNFYLNTPMKRYEYIRIKLTDIQQEIINQYNLTSLAQNG